MNPQDSNIGVVGPQSVRLGNKCIENLPIAEGARAKTQMPSVYEDEELYAPENITILAPYYFDVEIPDNYEAYSDGETSHGDCKREYVVNDNSSIFSVYVNGYYVGNNITSNALIDRDSTITAVLDVDIDVDIYRYKWDRDCIDYDEDDDCIEYEYECEFDEVENVDDSFTISDELDVRFYQELPQANFTVVDKYSDNVKIRPWIDTNTNGIIGFTEGYYYEYNTFYDVVYDYPPYYILTLRSNDYEISGKQGIFLDDGDIIYKSSNDCILYYWNHFTLNTSICNVDSEIERPIISTDKLVYNVNDTIQVYVEPADELILVTYANETQNVTGSTTFNAKHLQNRITAQLGQHKSSVSINVTKGNKLPIVFDFSVFFTIMLVFYRSIKAGLLGVGI